MLTDRERADEAEIEGPYKDLAIAVRRILGFYSHDAPLMSARQAALRCGVNHATISSIIRGGRGSRSSLKQFATAFDIDPEELLKLAGYSRAPVPTMKNAFRPFDPSNQPDGDSLPQRIYHKIERLSERDLRRLDQVLELWIDDGNEIGS